MVGFLKLAKKREKMHFESGENNNQENLNKDEYDSLYTPKKNSWLFLFFDLSTANTL